MPNLGIEPGSLRCKARLLTTTPTTPTFCSSCNCAWLAYLDFVRNRTDKMGQKARMEELVDLLQNNPILLISKTTSLLENACEK